jgi:hypothetical protein
VVWGQSQKTGTQHLPQTGTKPEPHAAPSTPIPVFEDVAARAGLTASHISSKDKRYVIESMSGGAKTSFQGSDVHIPFLEGSERRCIFFSCYGGPGQILR